MWYFLCVVLGLGIGIVAGICFEKLGKFLYYKHAQQDGHRSFGGTAIQLAARTKKLTGTEIDTVFVGDSITDGYSISEFYSGKKHLNRGINGDTAQRLIKRLDSNVFPLKPKRIIFLIGTNDLIATKQNEVNQDLAKIAELYKTIIEMTKKALPSTELIFESIYPINVDYSQNFGRTNERISKLNELLKAVCLEYSVRYLDMHPCLCDEKLNLKKDYTYDGLHLNMSGYSVITQFLKDNIDGL